MHSILRRDEAGACSRLVSITPCRQSFSKYGANAIGIFLREVMHLTTVRSLILITRTLSGMRGAVYPSAKLRWSSPMFFILLVSLIAMIPQGMCGVLSSQADGQLQRAKGAVMESPGSCASGTVLGEITPHKTAPCTPVPPPLLIHPLGDEGRKLSSHRTA